MNSKHRQSPILRLSSLATFLICGAISAIPIEANDLSPDRPGPNALHVIIPFSAQHSSSFYIDDSGKPDLTISIRKEASQPCVLLADLGSTSHPDKVDQCFSDSNKSIPYKSKYNYLITLQRVDPSGKYAEFLIDSDRPIKSAYWQFSFWTGIGTVAFLALIVLLSVFGKSVPEDTRWIVLIVFALGSAITAGCFLGGAAASGILPESALRVTLSGGFVVFVIVILFGRRLYVRPGEGQRPIGKVRKKESQAAAAKEKATVNQRSRTDQSSAQAEDVGKAEPLAEPQPKRAPDEETGPSNPGSEA